jgi:lipopolysaccharide biosynthesis glycosyltransferase
MMIDQPTDKQIHVALTFDDNFWAPAYAVMRSICLTTTRRRDLVFHLCHDHLKPERRSDLQKIAEEFGARLVHYALEQNSEFNALCRSLPVDGRLHVVMYARLLLDRLLPPEVNRVIYLDCDTMVMSPIEMLYDEPLAGRPIGAVLDPMRMLIVTGRDMRSKSGIFDPAEPYFNSGVLLVDRARYAEVDVPARLGDLKRDGLIEKLYFDQDMLNLIFRGNWHPLDWRFNVMDARTAHQTMHPHIIHYTGLRRPWNLVSAVAFARIYRHVMTNELFYRYMRHRWKRWWGKKLGRLMGRK